MSGTYFLCDPQSRLNWQHDWSDWLEQGDSITSRQWLIEPTGPTLTGATSDVVFVEDLEFGKIYRLTERIVTSHGLEDDQTIVIRCAQT